VVGIMDQEKIRIAALEAVNEIVGSFKRNPYSFLFESDLQAELFMQLRRRISGSLSVPRLSDPGGTYDLSLVYSEYGKRIDIVCLEASPVPPKDKLKRYKGFDIYIYDQPVLIGIELKYRKMGDQFDFGACAKDHEKLKNLKVKFPLVLGFVQEEQNLLPFLETAKTDWCWEKISEVTGYNQVFVIGPKSMYTATKKPNLST
jgi:hypothetical protein